MRHLAGMGYKGSSSPAEAVDFYMNDDVGTMKRLSLLICSRRMVNVELLPSLNDYLVESAPEFTVWLSSEFDDEDCELLFIELGKNEAVGMLETVETANAFGFNAKPSEVGPISLNMWE
jgi:hypothetical protein